MDYYEELGISPSATMDEIHKAHRRLSNLLHLDEQTDDAQMRRLNAIAGILCDPELRRQYDHQLKSAAVVPVTANSPRTARRHYFNLRFGWRARRRFLPRWIWTPLGAVVLTAGVVWFRADDRGSSFSNQTHTYARAPVREKTAPKNSRTNSNELASEAANGQDPIDTPSRIRSAIRRRTSRNTARRHLAVLMAKLDTAALTRKATETNAMNLSAGVNLSAPPELAVTASQPGMLSALVEKSLMPAATGVAPLRAGNQHPLAGEWVYAPRASEKRKSGLYPPEFIHLKLFWNGGSLHGQYQARYHVMDKPISPDVSFLLSPSDQGSRKFIWESSNGTRGTLKIRAIDPGTIHVEWRTTVYSKGPPLTAGTATLVRRSP